MKATWAWVLKRILPLAVLWPCSLGWKSWVRCKLKTGDVAFSSLFFSSSSFSSSFFPFFIFSQAGSILESRHQKENLSREGLKWDEMWWGIFKKKAKKKKKETSFLYQKGSFWKLPQIIALSTFASQRVASHCTQHWITFCSAMRRKWDGCKGTGIGWFDSCTREGNRWV